MSAAENMAERKTTADSEEGNTAASSSPPACLARLCRKVSSRAGRLRVVEAAPGFVSVGTTLEMAQQLTRSRLKSMNSRKSTKKSDCQRCCFEFYCLRFWRPMGLAYGDIGTTHGC